MKNTSLACCFVSASGQLMHNSKSFMETLKHIYETPGLLVHGTRAHILGQVLTTPIQMGDKRTFWELRWKFMQDTRQHDAETFLRWLMNPNYDLVNDEFPSELREGFEVPVTYTRRCKKSSCPQVYITLCKLLFRKSVFHLLLTKNSSFS